MSEIILNLSPEEKRQIEKEIGPIKTVAEFCSSMIEATKELPFKDTFTKLLPWAARGGRIVAEVTPLVKVLVKMVDEIAQEKDPDTLGLLACTLAYQRAAALAVAEQGDPASHVPFEKAQESARLALTKLSVGVDLSGFSLEAPLAHPFVWKSGRAFFTVVRSAGYSEGEWRQIQLRIHDQFRSDLVQILSHAETASRFEPFTKRLALGDHAAAYAALNAHFERQRWLFQERWVLNIEPFTLSDVYVGTDCGKLRWRDFFGPDSKRETYPAFDPFSEHFGGRHPLLETVFEYLRDPKFNDAIVIQGPPGSGKSSFTLRLANALLHEGLRPFRIRLKFWRRCLLGLPSGPRPRRGEEVARERPLCDPRPARWRLLQTSCY